MVGVFSLNCLVARTIELAVAEGYPLRLTKCGNVPGGDEYNRRNLVELGDAVGLGGSKGRDTSYPTQQAVRAALR